MIFPWEPQFDFTINVSALLSMGGACWLLVKGLRAIGRFETLLREFPPHRHVGGKIWYPRTMRPDEGGLDIRGGKG